MADALVLARNKADAVYDRAANTLDGCCVVMYPAYLDGKRLHSKEWYPAVIAREGVVHFLEQQSRRHDSVWTVPLLAEEAYFTLRQTPLVPVPSRRVGPRTYAFYDAPSSFVGLYGKGIPYGSDYILRTVTSCSYTKDLDPGADVYKTLCNGFLAAQAVKLPVPLAGIVLDARGYGTCRALLDCGVSMARVVVPNYCKATFADMGPAPHPAVTSRHENVGWTFSVWPAAVPVNFVVADLMCTFPNVCELIVIPFRRRLFDASGAVLSVTMSTRGCVRRTAAEQLEAWLVNTARGHGYTFDRVVNYINSAGIVLVVGWVHGSKKKTQLKRAQRSDDGCLPPPSRRLKI
jgi:hypothetical protein